MRLLFDLKSTQPQKHAKFHGAGKYGIAVFKRLIDICPEKVAVYYDENAFLDESVLNIIQKKNIPFYSSNKMSLYEAASKVGNVLYVPMLGAHEFPYPPSSIKIATTQHDLRHFLLKRDAYYFKISEKSPVAYFKYFLYLAKEYLWGNMKRNEVFHKIEAFYSLGNVFCFTVSLHSKYSLIDKCPRLPANKVRVYWAPSTINKLMEIDTHLQEYGKYWLLVGINRYEKNGLRALETFDSLFSNHPDIQGKVIATGWSDWSQIKIKIRNKKRFSLLGYVDEKTLKSLYHFAYCFIYPTLDEGFGYPPVEAMAEECPVIASATSSITEICQDGVLYFNPFSIDELKNRILQMEDENIHQLFRQKAVSRYKLIEERQSRDLDSLCNDLLNLLNI